MADSRVKAWEAFERAKQGLPIRGMVARDSDGTGSKRKGVAGRPRVCLACDLCAPAFRHPSSCLRESTAIRGQRAPP